MAPYFDAVRWGDTTSWKSLLQEALRDFRDFGWTRFKSGEWLAQLIQRSFREHWDGASVHQFEEEFPGWATDAIAKELIARAAKRAARVGAITGVIVSADEIAALLTLGEGLIGIPANVVVAIGSVAAELIMFLRIELRLIAELASLYGVTLDPDDPDEVLTIIALVGGARMTGFKEVLADKKGAALKLISAKAGKRMLRRSLLKNAVAVASIGIGAGSNYFATKSLGKRAMKQFRRTAG